MELKRDNWTEANGEEFNRFLVSCGQPDRVEWTTRILNTKMPVLAIPAPKVRELTREIAKGNFISFLELNLWTYFENTAINGSLIDRVKDFELYAKLLKRYGEQADNWATCDTVPFKPKPENKDKLFDLSGKFLASEKPFVRRLGVDMLFAYTADSAYNDAVLKRIADLQSEGEYYVNMCVAWLIAEYFTKQRTFGLRLFESGTLNAFTVNKAVQKCRDSYRISSEDKEMLLRFKTKKF